MIRPPLEGRASVLDLILTSGRAVRPAPVRTGHSSDAGRRSSCRLLRRGISLMRRAFLLAVMLSSLSVLAMTDTVPDDDPPDCGRSKPFPDCNYDRQAFPPRIQRPAAGWFELSASYPETVEPEPQPWAAYDPFHQDDARERW